jgi:hypothetical protein
MVMRDGDRRIISGEPSYSLTRPRTQIVFPRYVTSGRPNAARFSIQISTVSRFGFGYACPTLRNVGEPLLELANLVLATLPTNVATDPSRAAARFQASAPPQPIEDEADARCVTCPTEVPDTASAAAETATTTDLFTYATCSSTGEMSMVTSP